MRSAEYDWTSHIPLPTKFSLVSFVVPLMHFTAPPLTLRIRLEISNSTTNKEADMVEFLSIRPKALMSSRDKPGEARIALRPTGEPA